MKISNEYLLSLKLKHSKCEYLNVSNYMQEYLTSNELYTSEKKLLFAMRTKTVNVKTNYKHSYINNMLCRLCEKPDEDECEEHLLVCNELITDHKLRIDISKIRYNDIYGTFSQQKTAINLWKKVWNMWTRKLESLSPVGTPGAPCH